MHIALLLLPLLLLLGCRAEHWKGFYYQDRHNLGDETKTMTSPGEFSSLEECRTWVNMIVRSRPEDVYDYECGKNCKWNAEMRLNVCQETVR